LRKRPRILLDAIVYFDACPARFKECNNNCKNNPLHTCRHRLISYNVLSLKLGSYLNFLRLMDSQVILNFIWILNNKLSRRISRSTQLLLITHDKTFLKDAEQEWEKKRKKRTKPKLLFNISANTVTCGKLEIKIITSSNIGETISRINNLIKPRR